MNRVLPAAESRARDSPSHSVRFHALANGKTEAWVGARTGHRSSQMINRYRRAAQKVDELGLGTLDPLDVAIPELAPVVGAMVPVTTAIVPSAEGGEAAPFVAGLVARAMLRDSERRGTPRIERVGRAGLEPATYGLKVRSSTD